MKDSTRKFLKKHLGWTIVGGVLLLVAIFMLVINLIPPKKNVERNPFVVAEGELPMVAAHRGGGENNPENTMLAFREAVKMGVDILESDLWLTKDGYLVYNHDSYIDRTCETHLDLTVEEIEKLPDSEKHFIKDLTLDELKGYNFGARFEKKDKDGKVSYPYREYTAVEVEAAGLQITTVEKLFGEFYQSNPDLLFIVEIKDGGDRGIQACKVLWDALQAYPQYLDNIVVGTFHDEIETELKTNYPDLMRGAPTGTAAKFILTQFLGVNIFDKGDFACLQIPTSYKLGITLTLDKKTIITRAHQRNIAVQYWTINDPDEMRELIELGCDCIMTDNPQLLIEVLKEYKK